MTPEAGKPAPPADLMIGSAPIAGTADCAMVLSAVVCVKGLTADGAMAHWCRATNGLDLVEAQGMALALFDAVRDAQRGAPGMTPAEDEGPEPA